MDIVLRDKNGNIKQDYHISLDKNNKKIVEINTLKKVEIKLGR
jgi:hypothetical protein